MIFGVLCHKVLIYDFHIFKTSKFIISSWKGCIFGPVIFNRVWTLACGAAGPRIAYVSTRRLVNISSVWFQNSLYNGHCRDLEFVSSSARLCNRGSSVKCPLVVAFFCSHLFALSPRSERLAGNMFICAWDLAAFRCHRGVRYRGVSVRRGLSVIW